MPNRTLQTLDERKIWAYGTLVCTSVSTTQFNANPNGTLTLKVNIFQEGELWGETIN